jgi:hypothetical protein
MCCYDEDINDGYHHEYYCDENLDGTIAVDHCPITHRFKGLKMTTIDWDSPPPKSATCKGCGRTIEDTDGVIVLGNIYMVNSANGLGGLFGSTKNLDKILKDTEPTAFCWECLLEGLCIPYEKLAKILLQGHEVFHR